MSVSNGDEVVFLVVHQVGVTAGGELVLGDTEDKKRELHDGFQGAVFNDRVRDSRQVCHQLVDKVLIGCQ